MLSLDPSSGVGDVKWDHDTIDDAVKAGTMRAIDDAHDRGTLPGWAATALKTVVKHTPISWFLEHNPLDNIPLLDKLLRLTLEPPPSGSGRVVGVDAHVAVAQVAAVDGERAVRRCRGSRGS